LSSFQLMGMKRYTPLILSLIVFLTVTSAFAERIDTTTVVDTVYRVEPRFEPILKEAIGRLREILDEARSQDKLVGFVSIPLSARGGGNRDLNVEISEHIKQRIEKRFGEEHFFALAPGLVESSLPSVDGVHAAGGEYMYMWTEVLAGEKGLGEHFDLVYFSGPTDFATYFGLTGEDDLGRLRAFMLERAAKDSRFAESISSPEAKRAFLRYYAMRASVSFSDGSHDEWNVFRRVNERRRKILGIGEQIPVFFDGRQMPAAVMETPVSEGYEVSQ
jgi:hypothetical protein